MASHAMQLGLGGLLLVVGATAHARPGVHKANDVTLKRGIVSIQIDPSDKVTTKFPVPDATMVRAKATQVRAKATTPVRAKGTTLVRAKAALASLARGKVAKLDVAKPVAAGIMLVATRGAVAWPASSPLAPAGLHFDGRAGKRSLRPLVALVLDASKIDGDDLLVECEGVLPETTEVSVIHLAPGAKLDVAHATHQASDFGGGLASGKASFFVPTAGLDGMLAIGLSAESGHGRIDRCTVSREAP